MIYLKSYCYSQHELPFVIANLMEGYDFIEKLVLYEYNYTHTGVKKEYEMEKVLHLVPEHLKDKLYYKKVDLTNYVEYAYTNGPLIHNVNEPIQRSWMFNDPFFNLQDEDVIIDHDIDEIIYKSSYPTLLQQLQEKKHPLGVRLHQFFFTHTYLWTDCSFSSPTIYTYGMVKPITKKIKGLHIKNLRDLPERYKTKNIFGCHMSWIMPVEYMIKKLHSYSHPEYRSFADKERLQQAINDKKYIFDPQRSFTIEELALQDKRIPTYLQQKNIFEYL